METSVSTSVSVGMVGRGFFLKTCLSPPVCSFAPSIDSSLGNSGLFRMLVVNLRVNSGLGLCFCPLHDSPSSLLGKWEDW